MKIIAFISRKGGCGKTTNVAHTAALLSQKHTVLVLETDPNYTLHTLRKMELFQQQNAPEDAPYRIEICQENELEKRLAQIKKQGGYEFVIVDSAGKTTDEHSKKLCLASDLVVIPTSLSQNDVIVAYQTVEDLKVALELRKKLEIVILPNRIHANTKIETVKNQLVKLNATVLSIFVPNAKKFADFSTLHALEAYRPILDAMLEKT
jgi:chromosome partitioning protein